MALVHFPLESSLHQGHFHVILQSIHCHHIPGWNWILSRWTECFLFAQCLFSGSSAKIMIPPACSGFSPSTDSLTPPISLGGQGAQGVRDRAGSALGFRPGFGWDFYSTTWLQSLRFLPCVLPNNIHLWVSDLTNHHLSPLQSLLTPEPRSLFLEEQASCSWIIVTLSCTMPVTILSDSNIATAIPSNTLSPQIPCHILEQTMSLSVY